MKIDLRHRVGEVGDVNRVRGSLCGYGTPRLLLPIRSKTGSQHLITIGYDYACKLKSGTAHSPSMPLELMLNLVMFRQDYWQHIIAIITLKCNIN